MTAPARRSLPILALGGLLKAAKGDGSVSKTVAVILDDDHWFWAYDVSLAILAVEVKQIIDSGAFSREPWVDGLLEGLGEAVRVQGTFGLQVPTDMTELQLEQFQALFTETAQRLRTRGNISADQAARDYVFDGHPVFLRGTSTIDPAPVASLADAIVDLVRGELPPTPPGTTAWLFGWDDTPSAL